MRPIYNDELYHYGKVGMKWGHRNSKGLGIMGVAAASGVAKIHKGIAGIQQKSANKYKKDADSIKTQKDKMLELKDKKGNSLFKKEDIEKMISALDSKYKNKQSKANNHKQFANKLISQIGQLKNKT